MCGIIGIVGKDTVAPALYDALTILQHRGQDAAGIATLDGYQIKLHKASGLVRDVFEPEQMAILTGNVGIGHVRYPTAGRDDSSEAQPFYVNSPYGIALGHNGNLINTEELSQALFDSDPLFSHRHPATGKWIVYHRQPPGSDYLHLWNFQSRGKGFPIEV